MSAALRADRLLRRHRRKRGEIEALFARRERVLDEIDRMREMHTGWVRDVNAATTPRARDAGRQAIENLEVEINQWVQILREIDEDLVRAVAEFRRIVTRLAAMGIQT